jgi:hypothetical protein
MITAFGFAACGGSSDDGTGGPPPNPTGSPEDTGSFCEVPADCYPTLDHDTLSGEPICLKPERDGYCTHRCDTDEDCCAAEGECKTELRQVCAPFTSTGIRMCFLSCEDADVSASGLDDDLAYCQREAGRDFTCRSTGGGAENRKVCFPVDCGAGAACAADDECPGDLTCLRDFAGGYCGIRGCNTNGDCPGNSVCVAGATGNLCMASCARDGDCSLCRGELFATACEANVDLAEGGTASVCRPVPANP